MNIETRFEYLENELRKTKIFVRFLCLVILVLLAGGAIATTVNEKNKVIKASQFIVIDENGQERVLLGIKNNQVGLTVYDSKNDFPRAMLAVDAYGPSFALTDENGVNRINMHAGKDDRGDDASGIGLFNSDSVMAIMFATNPGLGPSLVLTDKAGNRAFLGLYRNEPVLHLYDENGKNIWSAP